MNYCSFKFGYILEDNSTYVNVKSFNLINGDLSFNNGIDFDLEYSYDTETD